MHLLHLESKHTDHHLDNDNEEEQDDDEDDEDEDNDKDEDEDEDDKGVNEDGNDYSP